VERQAVTRNWIIQKLENTQSLCQECAADHTSSPSASSQLTLADRLRSPPKAVSALALKLDLF
jgi:hypothetical protein